MGAARTIEVSGGDIALRDGGGDGLPLLMLHGSGASKDVFTRQFDSPLAPSVRPPPQVGNSA